MNVTEIIQKTLFITIFSLFISSSFVLYNCQTVFSLELPSFITSESAHFLTGEINDYDFKTKLNLDDIKDKQFQIAFEAEIDDNIPFKEADMLLSSSFQRYAIEISNGIFNWIAYPTFYGSNYYYNHEINALAQFQETLNLTYFEKFAEELKHFSDIHNKYRYCVVLPDTPGFSTINPVKELCSNYLTSSDVYKSMNDYFKNTDNVVLSFEESKSIDECYQNFYTTDPHWNGWGTLKSYENFAPSMNLKSFNGELSNINIKNWIINGSAARGGLMLLNEMINEPNINVRYLRPNTTGLPGIFSSNPLEFLHSYFPYTEFNFYGMWYYFSASGTPIITNPSATNDNTAIIIGDSYSDTMQWLLATEYKTTVVLNLLHHQNSGSDNLYDYISEYKPTDIYFVARIDDYESFNNRHPDFFKLNNS